MGQFEEKLTESQKQLLAVFFLTAKVAKDSHQNRAGGGDDDLSINHVVSFRDRDLESRIGIVKEIRANVGSPATTSALVQYKSKKDPRTTLYCQRPIKALEKVLNFSKVKVKDMIPENLLAELKSSQSYIEGLSKGESFDSKTLSEPPPLDENAHHFYCEDENEAVRLARKISEERRADKDHPLDRLRSEPGDGALLISRIAEEDSRIDDEETERPHLPVILEGGGDIPISTTEAAGEPGPGLFNATHPSANTRPIETVNGVRRSRRVSGKARPDYLLMHQGLDSEEGEIGEEKSNKPANPSSALGMPGGQDLLSDREVEGMSSQSSGPVGDGDSVLEQENEAEDVMQVRRGSPVLGHHLQLFFNCQCKEFS